MEWGGQFLSSLVYGVSIFDLSKIYTSNPPIKVVEAARLAQIFSSVGIFLVPALLVPKLVIKAPTGSFLANGKFANIKYYLFAILLYVSFIPSLGWMIELNKNIHLPDFLSGMENWMRALETKGEVITRNFLFMENGYTLVFNLVVIALIPAICEELFFRGMLQRLIHLWTGKIHLAIILTGCIFSFIHFQFFGFIPRAALGILLGYILYYSGDIKVSILIHFINNGSSVVASFIYQRTTGEIIPPEEVISIQYIIVSILIFGLLMFNYFKISKRRTKNMDNILENSASNFKKVFETMYTASAEIVKGRLETAGIQSVILNKQDSSYTAFGWIEVYVPAEEIELSTEIIQQIKDSNV